MSSTPKHLKLAEKHMNFTCELSYDLHVKLIFFMIYLFSQYSFISTGNTYFIYLFSHTDFDTVFTSGFFFTLDSVIFTYDSLYTILLFSRDFYIWLIYFHLIFTHDIYFHVWLLYICGFYTIRLCSHVIVRFDVPIITIITIITIIIF